MANVEFASAMEAADIKIVFNKMSGDLKDLRKAKKQISGNFKPKSIAALARDQIMTFPIYVSGDVPAEAGVVIIKALEKQYSSFAMLALSNHLNYDSTKYQNIGDVISEIHTNEDAPNLMKYIINLGENISNAASMFESTIVMNADELEALKYNLFDEITMESINNLYKPNEGSIDKVEFALEGKWSHNSRDSGIIPEMRYTVNIPRATRFKNREEDGMQYQDTPNYADTDMYYMHDYEPGTKINANFDADKNDVIRHDFNKSVSSAIKTTKTDSSKSESQPTQINQKSSNREDFDKFKQAASKMQTSDIGFRGSKSGIGRASVQMFDENKYFGQYAGALVPTVITSTITVDGESRDFMIAIKGTAHVVPKEQMDSMLIDAVHDNELAFKIIKWSKGESKFFRDFVFGIKDARNDAIMMRSGNAWAPALKRRKMASKAFVGGGAPISPISTLVITDTDIETVKAATGIDIARPAVARKLIRDYFLLSIVVYNTQDQTIMTMLDADVNPGWANTTLSGLKSSNAKGNNGKMEFDSKDILKMLGRY